MVQDPFPDRGHDGEESAGSGLLSAGGDGPADAGAGPEQGLFVCLPAEELSLAGFAQDGRADMMAPGPLLASIVEAVLGDDGAGLAGLGDDQLVGVISAARRMESRTTWMLLAALRELARRRPPGAEPGDTGLCGVSDFAADEVADELHLTVRKFVAQSFASYRYAREGGPVKTEGDPLDATPAGSRSSARAAASPPPRRRCGRDCARARTRRTRPLQHRR